MVKRKIGKPKNNFLSLTLIIVGSSFVIFSTVHSFLRLRSLSLDKQVVATYQVDSRQEVRPPLPVHIYSQYFLDIGIEGQVYQDDKWTISEHSASYLFSSARPAEQGNIIIYGHNTRAILGNIRAYKGGEIITLTMSDGTKREYRVKDMRQLPPDKTDLLAPTLVETLTIYTCSGFMDSQRFVVRAFPI